MKKRVMFYVHVLYITNQNSWQRCILHVLLFKSDQRHLIISLWYCCTPIVQSLLAKNFQSILIPIKSWGKNWIDNLMLAKLPMYWQPASHTIIDLNLNTCNKLDELTNDLHLWKLTLTLTELANSIIKRVPIPLYYDIIHLSKYSISHYLWIDLVFVFKRPRALPYHKKYNLVISYPILFAIRNFNLLKIIDEQKKRKYHIYISHFLQVWDTHKKGRYILLIVKTQGFPVLHPNDVGHSCFWLDGAVKRGSVAPGNHQVAGLL